MKVHLRDNHTPRERYKGSPHVLAAIDRKFFTLCSILAKDYVTDDIQKVECFACKKIDESKFIRSCN